jgi:hypothetical protein
MTKPGSSDSLTQRGQVIVIVAVALTVLLAAVALVIDGGNAYAQQRKTQNGIDAAAEAGAAQLARSLVGVAITDWDVRTAVEETATANNISTVDLAEYTDVDGVPLGTVGGGTIPPDTQGVKVGGSRDFATFIGGVVGLAQWKASAEATAVTGFADESGFGGLIPLTFPILLTECGTTPPKLFFPDDGVPPPGTEWPFGPNNRVAIPLCPNGPGHVGWIDWDGGGGGVAELDQYIRGVKKNPPISTPYWYEIIETGDKTALDAPMDTLEGTDITIPIFYARTDDPATPAVDESLLGTCDPEPSPRNIIGGCPVAGTRANGLGWYFLETFAVFHLEHSYIQGSHHVECNDPALVSPASPPGTSVPQQVDNCLVGYFKDRVVAKNMTVGSGTATSAFTPLAIQLIH